MQTNADTAKLSLDTYSFPFIHLLLFWSDRHVLTGLHIFPPLVSIHDEREEEEEEGGGGGGGNSRVSNYGKHLQPVRAMAV